MSLEDYRYRAFISYSHADEKWASWLHKSLETYRVPKHLVGQETAVGTIPARLAPVFRDREELTASTDLGKDLRAALEGSACQIVICSRRSAQSHWVNEEILAFKRLGRSDRIFCLIVDGEPYASTMPGREDEECFAPALHYIMGEDGELTNTPAEPIAADARPGKDGKANAKMKLLAGLLGVGFDALRQRELQRRHRRMALISTASTAGMVLAIGLATVAVIARNEADAQRVRAEREAETALQTSDFLVSLFQVSDPSEARGKSITAREILTAGADRIDAELGDQPEVQTRLMDTIGRVYTSLGLYDDAQVMLDSALSRRRNLEGITDSELSQSMVGLASVMTVRAELEEAETLYLEAIERLTDAGLEDSEEMTDSLAGLAELYFRMGRFEDAEPLLERVLAARRQSLGDDAPEVFDAMEELALNRWDQGRLEDAESGLREALYLRRDHFGAEPHPDLAENINNLALLLMDLGEYDESEILYTEAQAMTTRLYGDQHPALAVGLNNLGQLYRAKGDLAAAESAYEDSLAMSRRLLGEIHPDIAMALVNLALVHYDQARLDVAIGNINQALDIQSETLGPEHPEVAANMSTLGRWHAETGDLEQSEALLRGALKLMNESLDPGHPDIAIAEIGLASTLTRLEKLDEALSVAGSGRQKLVDAFGGDHWIAALGRSIEGGVLSALGRYEDAEPLLTQSYELLSTAPGARPVYVAASLERVIGLYEAWGKNSEAQLYRENL